MLRAKTGGSKGPELGRSVPPGNFIQVWWLRHNEQGEGGKEIRSSQHFKDFGLHLRTGVVQV